MPQWIFLVYSMYPNWFLPFQSFHICWAQALITWVQIMGVRKQYTKSNSNKSCTFALQWVIENYYQDTNTIFTWQKIERHKKLSVKPYSTVCVTSGQASLGLSRKQTFYIYRGSRGGNSSYSETSSVCSNCPHPNPQTHRCPLRKRYASKWSKVDWQLHANHRILFHHPPSKENAGVQTHLIYQQPHIYPSQLQYIYSVYIFPYFKETYMWIWGYKHIRVLYKTSVYIIPYFKWNIHADTNIYSYFTKPVCTLFRISNETYMRIQTHTFMLQNNVNTILLFYIYTIQKMKYWVFKPKRSKQIYLHKF